MKKDFKKDLSKRRNDSPLRWPATVHHTTTHDERIRWLLYENERIYGDLITAKLFVAIAQLKYISNRKSATNLQEYKAIKLAFKLWHQALQEEREIKDLWLDNYRHTKDW
tara:strand:+ start:135 stop:464 length:330 start_codon:yes stop_codon:yes gene_type:complete